MGLAHGMNRRVLDVHDLEGEVRIESAWQRETIDQGKRRAALCPAFHTEESACPRRTTV